MRRGLLTLSVLLALTSASVRTAAEQGSGQLEIEAELVELDRAEGEARFTGNVVLRRAELELRCERLTARLSEEGEVTGVEASGDVRIEAGGLRAVAGSARYEVGAGRLVLRGNPLVRSASGELRGQVITLEVSTGRVSIEGARGVFRVH